MNEIDLDNRIHMQSGYVCKGRMGTFQYANLL